MHLYKFSLKTVPLGVWIVITWDNAKDSLALFRTTLISDTSE